MVLCYAVKANTFITKELIDTIHRFEVCSPGEAEICRAVGVPSENMVISGVYKTPEVMEAMDMDQFTNPQVRQAVLTLRREVQSIPGIRYYQCTWNPRFKGVDDYLLDWTKRKTA